MTEDNKQINISVDILSNILNEIYECGFNDGYNTFFNNECATDDRFKQFVDGKSKMYR